jgi:hypothetical protein
MKVERILLDTNSLLSETRRELQESAIARKKTMVVETAAIFLMFKLSAIDYR